MDKAVYSTTVATLGFVCFTVAAIAVGLPLWGYFDNPEGESPRTRRRFCASGLRRAALAAVCHFHLSLFVNRFFLGSERVQDFIIAFVRAQTKRVFVVCRSRV